MSSVDLCALYTWSVVTMHEQCVCVCVRVVLCVCVCVCVCVCCRYTEGVL